MGGTENLALKAEASTSVPDETGVNAAGAVASAQVLPWDDGLRMVAEMRSLANDLEAHFVRKARNDTVSWERIGSALGVSRQAAHTRHHR